MCVFMCVCVCVYIYIYIYIYIWSMLTDWVLTSQSVRLDQSVNIVYENNCLFWELYETNVLCGMNSLIFNATVGVTYIAPGTSFKRWSKAYLSSLVGRSYVLSFYPISGMQKNCSLLFIDWFYCAATARLFNDAFCSSAHIASNDTVPKKLLAASIGDWKELRHNWSYTDASFS